MIKLGLGIDEDDAEMEIADSGDAPVASSSMEDDEAGKMEEVD